MGDDEDRRASDQEIRELLEELLADEDAHGARTEVCETVTDALVKVGRLLWVTGAMLGPDREAGESPFGFGKDDTVGLATVAQIGGELARGTIQLLKEDNLYAASALMRQLVEVQYLAAAFAGRDQIAADWLRADRAQRRKFWNAGELRKRASGFLASDYWEHCDRGGHPTREGLLLLPDHQRLHDRYLWTDLAGHLHGIWTSIMKAIEVRAEALPDEVKGDFSRVAAASEQWLQGDGLRIALFNLDQIRVADE